MVLPGCGTQSRGKRSEFRVTLVRGAARGTERAVRPEAARGTAVGGVLILSRAAGPWTAIDHGDEGLRQAIERIQVRA